MYKKVRSEEDLHEWHRIKKVSWDEKGFDMEYAKPNSEQYLFFIDGKAGGTFEFTPYEYVSDHIRSIFDDVLTPNMRVIETDSFAVLPEFRGRLGREIICMMVAYAGWHGFTHSIGLSDPGVFHSFNNTYHIEAERVGKDLFYKGAMAIPTVFHLGKAYSNLSLSQYSWYTQPIELQGDLIHAK